VPIKLVKLRYLFINVPVSTQELELVMYMCASIVALILLFLRVLNWIWNGSELQQHRKRAKVIMLYRIVNHLVAISSEPEPYFIPRGVALTTRGHDIRFLLPYSRIQSHQQSFFQSTIRLWNELPTAVVTVSTLEGFKDSLQTVMLPCIRHAGFNCRGGSRGAHPARPP
jgi:hypothetical protein